MYILPRAQCPDNWHRMDPALLFTHTSKLSTSGFKGNFIMLLLYKIEQTAFFFAPFQVNLENAKYELELLKVSLVHSGNQLVV